MKKNVIITGLVIFLWGCNGIKKAEDLNDWSISVLPSSVRIDPSTNEIIDHRFVSLKSSQDTKSDLLEKNWIYNEGKAFLHAARGEYVSFQLVITRNSDLTLENIQVDIPPFQNSDFSFTIKPELFLEWSVEVKTPSTGYPNASLGTGWYPDALIPFKYIQTDSSEVGRYWVYPLWLPDFNNRIDNQKSLIVWIDQFIPHDDIIKGSYSTTVSVAVGDEVQEIPVELRVWDFAVPNENNFKACLQHEGFLKSMTEKQELEMYQLFKRNRVSLLDPTYDPSITVSKTGKVQVEWSWFDSRLSKYFSGDAFTSEFGYAYGPGYGEPIESFALPFDVYGKHHTKGWPDIGKPDVERSDENRGIYIQSINLVRDHLSTIINPEKTDITAYLNGLDESYFPEAWDRMVYFGDLFSKYYPEAQFRIDGSYSEEAMAIVKNHIDAWASHTLNYDVVKIKKYQEMGIKDWIYGPLIYESKVNGWVGSSTFIDLPLVNDRGLSWTCWKYGAHSWISWGIGAGWVSGWYDSETRKNQYKEGADTDSTYTFKKINGNALLAYSPGVVPNVNGACPSIRLKTMRDGIEEYEYMRLLADLDGSTDRVDSLVNQIINQPFGPNAVGEIDIWSFDSKKWDLTRIELGELIEQMK